jgi:hypothetical protein
MSLTQLHAARYVFLVLLFVFLLCTLLAVRRNPD